MNDVWEVMEDNLYFLVKAFEVRIHLFVLMINHYHAIITAPHGNLAPAMQYFQAQTARQITKPAGRINHLWRAKYFRSCIGTHHYYLNAYKYFYRNPVAAGVCERVEDYPFSTLHGLLGKSKLIVPVCEDLTLFSDVDGTLAWLNTKPKDTYSDEMRRALRRRVFTLPRKRNGKASDLETKLY